jgi:4-aminobutyrate aminotransferase-like enzyme
MSSNVDLLDRRVTAFGPNAPLFYDRPLNLVRGEGCWVWEADGTRFLDCYNNVPHVGHCHPHVTRALCAQAGRINVSTRYLHEAILDYSERLLATFPTELDRAVFVCTGTEANELALRIARTQSGNAGVIVSDFSYHGNSAGLAEITTGLPHPEPFSASARAVALPNPYSWEGAMDEMISHHLSLIDAAIRSLQEGGYGVAAALFDTAFSTEGLLNVPPAYVQGVADRVRQAGGYLIADEVQAGFGRMGDAMWGFEGPGVVPDFATLGKPMGNGHPIGAVITRGELVDRFTQDALYFNTFGGNPVSAAVGLAVLEALDEDRLVERAHETGQYLQERLSGLASRFPCMADVRGRGLFAAVEIVDADQAPDPTACRAIVNGMRDRHVLISRIGPADNVLKIRPPMSFGMDEADLFIAALEATIEGLEGISQ